MAIGVDPSAPAPPVTKTRPSSRSAPPAAKTAIGGEATLVQEPFAPSVGSKMWAPSQASAGPDPTSFPLPTSTRPSPRPTASCPSHSAGDHGGVDVSDHSPVEGSKTSG